jgi:hypothetical protein
LGWCGIRFRAECLAHAIRQRRVFTHIPLEPELDAVSILIEKVDLVFVTSLRKSIEAEIPGFECAFQRSHIGFVGGEICEAQLVDLVAK